MKTEEARKAKSEMESKILSIIAEFEQSTGFVVESVYPYHVNAMGQPCRTVGVNVEARV